jgi:hypothetical protein
MKTSYVHKKFAGSMPVMLGFSARLDKVKKLNKNGEQEVDVSFTFCNKADKQFSKKIARNELADKPKIRIRVLDLPRTLAEADGYAFWGEPENNPRDWRVSEYNYVLRRFV